MHPDVLGSALAAPVAGQPLLVERSDGHTSGTDLDWWLRRDNAEPPADIQMLKHVTAGPALDVGCCTGRHMELLARRGIDVQGIDICSEAVTRARAAGLRAEIADVHDYQPPRSMQAVLGLGGGIGLAGRRAQIPEFLNKLASWMTDDGVLAISSIDWTATADKHKDWVDAAVKAGRYPGEVRLRLRYGDLTGDWFDWVWVDVATLQQDCQKVGLAVIDIDHWGVWYGAVIRRGYS